MKNSLRVFFLSAVLATAVSQGNEKTEKVFAKAKLQPRSGSKVTGKVTFLRDADNLRIEANLENASPGLHGFHIHEKGDCHSADAKSAGEHFSPTGTNHGAPGTVDSHVGDLGNLPVDKDGKGKLILNLKGTSDAVKAAWNDIIGKSIILHAGKDDLKSQPSGNSGDRIACGVIEAAK